MVLLIAVWLRVLPGYVFTWCMTRIEVRVFRVLSLLGEVGWGFFGADADFDIAPQRKRTRKTCCVERALGGPGQIVGVSANVPPGQFRRVSI